MSIFGWVTGAPDPPAQWDLRARGWTLCGGDRASRTECRHVLIADVRGLGAEARLAMAEGDLPSWRMIMIGVEVGAERAQLLVHGCAEVVAAEIGLRELDVRAQRVAEMFNVLPRWRSVGPLTLDLFHRDARHGARWLALHPREFGVLWRLSDQPGAVITRRQLLRDVWRISQEPETNSVEVHVSRLRTKLAAAGCPALIETAPDGGYRLARQRPFMLAEAPPARPAREPYSPATARPSRSRSR
ncbi:MAG: winged helix-turn-helix domain-containing protein [Croceibacterium sp.]